MNFTSEELEHFCERLLTLHNTGVYIPPPSVPHVCKTKSKNTNRTRKYKQSSNERKITFGKGLVGRTCQSYGVKNCNCCNQGVTQTNMSNNNKNRDMDKIIAILNNTPYEITSDDDSGSNDTIILNSESINLNWKLAQDEILKDSLNLIDNNQSTSNETKAETEEDIMEYVKEITKDINIDEYMKNNSVPSSANVTEGNIEELEEAAEKMLKNYRMKEQKRLDFKKCLEVLPSTSFNVQQSEDNENSDVKIVKIERNQRRNQLQKKKSKLKSVNVEPIVIDDSIELIEEPNDPPVQNTFKAINCPVCLESFADKEIMSTTCGHLFCSTCIKNVIKCTKRCPNCRKNLTLKSIHPIYI